MLTEFDITTATTGVYRGPKLHQTSAELLNDLLKDNQSNYHVYFSEAGGFHNHRAHHLLAAYALGGTPEHLQLAHDTVESAQRLRFPIDQSCIEKMESTQGLESMRGDDRHFHEYLAFFLQKFKQDDWKETVKQYLFARTALADDLFIRLFAGIWHNFILFGYGVEFEKPAVIAEGLAGACVHSGTFGPYLLECERLAESTKEPCKSLLKILEDIRNDPTLCDIGHWKGGNSFAYDDDVMSNAPPGMARVAAEWKVDDLGQLPYRTVELINVNAFLAGAAQRADRQIKIDFLFIHHINASIFFSALLQQDWMTGATKARLLIFYARMNLLFYAASLRPELHADEIIDYPPLHPGSTWPSLIQRALVLPDDGHLPKLVRALAHDEEASRPFEKQDDEAMLPVKGQMWIQIANMAVDSAEKEPDLLRRWVRGSGSDEAWAEVATRV